MMAVIRHENPFRSLIVGITAKNDHLSFKIYQGNGPATKEKTKIMVGLKTEMTSFIWDCIKNRGVVSRHHVQVNFGIT